MPNRLDKPFKVGDRVVVNQKGFEIYGHSGDFPVGRTGKVVSIPQERWHNNEVVVEFDDAPGKRRMGGCWAYDWAVSE